jgi:hypothetical protein
MPSHCSLQFGTVRRHPAAAPLALRQSHLALVARESMKITGASRRSAAPGSQSVGVAEYGAELCHSQHHLASATKWRIQQPALGSFHLQFCAPRSSAGHSHWHARSRAQAEALAGQFVVRICAILCFEAATNARNAHWPQNTQFLSARWKPFQERRLTLRST